MMSLTDRIKSFARALQFDLIGVAPATPPPYAPFYPAWLEQGYAGEMSYLEHHPERRQDPRLVLPGARSVIVAAVNYQPAPSSAEDRQPRGVIARYAWGTDYHIVLHEKLESLLRYIRSEARVAVEARIYVDTGPVLERDLAARAGLGWYGKHTNLIHKRIGSWLLIGEILTDLTLEYDTPVTAHCGTCTRCLEACPTGAIVEPYVVDSRKCISYLTIELKGAMPEAYREAVGNRIFGCDDCQDVCPWNRRAPIAPEETFAPRSWTDAPALIDMIGWTEDEYRERVRNSPIKRAKRRGLLRNVAVALGNSGDPAAIPALRDALIDDEPLVRSHAAWALGQLGGDQALKALQNARARESDPDALREIDRAMTRMEGQGESPALCESAY